MKKKKKDLEKNIWEKRSIVRCVIEENMKKKFLWSVGEGYDEGRGLNRSQ